MNTIRTGLALPITRVYLLESGHRPHASHLSEEIKNLTPQTIKIEEMTGKPFLSPFDLSTIQK